MTTTYNGSEAQVAGNPIKLKEVVNFSCYSLRNIENPLSNNGNELSNGFKFYTVLVNIADLPKNLENWRDINPRDPNVNSIVSRDIMATLKDNPNTFFLRNRGLTILADKLEYDNKINTIKIAFSDSEVHGLLDGGHTFEVIQKYLKDYEPPYKAYVKLEIMTGFSSDKENVDEAVNIVRARNKSTQVPNASLQNLEGHFDFIKEVLKGKPYFNRIAFKDNELNEEGYAKDIDLLDIISYLICFDIFSFPNDKTAPTVAYSSKGTLPNKFKVEGFRDNIEKLSHLLPKILELRDTIIKKIPENWINENGTRRSLGLYKDVKESKIELPFNNTQTDYDFSSAYFFPILASFRALINRETLDWKYELTDELIHEVFMLALKDMMDKRKSVDNVTQLGKDKTIWTACFKTVNTYMQDKKILELEAQLQSRLL